MLALIGNQSLSDFAKEHDLNVSHLSQIKTRKRNIGDQLAQTIEGKLQLPKGWMDAAHPEEMEGAHDMPLLVDDPQKLALLALFDALPQGQKAEMIRWAEEKEQANRENYKELRPIYERKYQAEKAKKA